MARAVKEMMLKELEREFQDIHKTGCVLVSCRGLKGDEARRLRQDIRRKGADMTVVKNSLFGLAMEHLGVGGLKPMLQGPVAVVRADDPVVAAKVVEEMAKAVPAVEVRGAYVDGQVVGPEGVGRLARLPGRQTLLSTIAVGLMGPARRLAFALTARQRALLNALEGLKKAVAGRQQAGSAEPVSAGPSGESNH